MGDSLKKPITYLKVEEYEPDGWLQLAMGKAVWIPIYSADQVGFAMGSIEQRLGA